MATPQQILDTAVNWAVKAPSARSADEILARIRGLRTGETPEWTLRNFIRNGGLLSIPLAMPQED